MGLSYSIIKRWARMLTGRSVWHVNQKIGDSFSVSEIKGYYNDLTQKVIMIPDLIDTDKLPILDIGDGKSFEFPVAIFQYGLGAYDLFLQTNDERYRKKFIQAVNWTVFHQEASGAWDNFSYYYPEHPNGAMAQGEGVSLLIRAYVELNDLKYLECAKKAIDFMLLSTKDGGTTLYKSDGAIILLEYPHRKAVLNGWIFAWWGLYDYVLITKDCKRYKRILNQSEKTLREFLPKYSKKVWSAYDLEGRIASPFYHNLHIAQMQVMYRLTGDDLYNDIASIWIKQQRNFIYLTIAFIKKSIQKLRE